MVRIIVVMNNCHKKIQNQHHHHPPSIFTHFPSFKVLISHLYIPPLTQQTLPTPIHVAPSFPLPGKNSKLKSQPHPHPNHPHLVSNSHNPSPLLTIFYICHNYPSKWINSDHNTVNSTATHIQIKKLPISLISLKPRPVQPQHQPLQ